MLRRKPFLEELNPRGGETICEIGCGNCDNLIKIFKRNQNVNLIGFDYPEERIKVASKLVKEKGLEKNIKVVCGLAHEYVFDEQIDRFIFSYSLSSIPDPRKCSLMYFNNYSLVVRFT